LSKIIINLGLRRLYYYENGQLARDYPIAIGKPSTPTPTGDWKIIAKIKHPGGILGTRWLGLDIPNGPYGIHGTPHPWTIGKAISHGCIRMYNHDVEELFKNVRVGTSVKIISSWNSTDTPPPVADPSPKSPSSETIPSSQLDKPKTYVVQKGDSLWAIARRFNISLNKLIRVNNIKTPNMLHVGQKLIIPG